MLIASIVSCVVLTFELIVNTSKRCKDEPLSHEREDVDEDDEVVKKEPEREVNITQQPINESPTKEEKPKKPKK